MKQNRILSGLSSLLNLDISNLFIHIMIIASIILVSASSVSAIQSAVNLGTAGNFVILSKTGISTTGVTSIVGDIGVSPIDSTAITGFGLIMDSSGQFSTSSLVTGSIYAANYAIPTPTTMTTAIGDMQTAYTDAAGRVTPDFSDIGAGEIGGLTLAPGLYKWGTGVTISTDVTINGSSTDVWIFQVAGTLGIGNGKQIILSGGAQASNIFWQVAGQTTIGTTSVFYGNILCQTAIVLNTGSTLSGRALAQTAVTADANSFSLPAGAPVLTTITLVPATANLAIGASQQMNATGFDQFSAPIAAIISYNSSNSSVAAVNASTGLVTAVASGNTTITAKSGAVSATSVITVLPAAVLTSITLLPATANLTIGAAQQMNATGFDQYNQTIAAIMAYASDNLSVATVNSASGLVTAVASGNAIINASSGNTSATSVITVLPAAVLTSITLLPATANLSAGNTLQLNATGFDQYNQPITATIAYASDNLSVSTVDANGLVTAVASGNAIINASSGNTSATSIITVETAAPILNAIGSKIVTQGAWLNFTITATSPDGLNLTFAISGQPATANFTDNLDGTAAFSWMPNSSDVGVANVNFTVTDSIKSASEAVAITVNAFQAPTSTPANPGNTWTNADFNVTLNATGFNSTPIAYINYTLNNVPGQIIGGFGTVLITSSGNNTLTFFAVDTLGNVETPSTIYALLDKISPNITSFTLSATSVNIGDTITGTCAVTDSLDLTIAGVITGIDTSTAGTKTATCTATDLAGNIATAPAAYTVNAVSSGGSGGGGGGGGAKHQCNDYIDNDQDGLTDYPDDPGCTSMYDDSELSANAVQKTACQERWVCSEWQPAECKSGETQTRTCEEVNNCGTYKYEELTARECVAATPSQAAKTTDLSSTGQTGENLVTGQAISQGGYTPSWWVVALVLFAAIGLVSVAYIYFRD